MLAKPLENMTRLLKYAKIAHGTRNTGGCKKKIKIQPGSTAQPNRETIQCFHCLKLFCEGLRFIEFLGFLCTTSFLSIDDQQGGKCESLA